MILSSCKWPRQAKEFWRLRRYGATGNRHAVKLNTGRSYGVEKFLEDPGPFPGIWLHLRSFGRLMNFATCCRSVECLYLDQKQFNQLTGAGQ